MVKKFLEKSGIYRDNDNLLIAEIIRHYEDENIKKMSAEDLLKAIEDRRYGTFEGIRRSRQKWQENHEDLRGELWEERQAYKGLVCEQLRFW